MILVTGGTGFLGSRLIQLLVDQGNAVIAIKRAKSAIPEKLKSSSLIQWVEADITDYFALADIFEGVTEVYHCAAKVSYQKRDALQVQLINIEGTKHIVNLCLEYGARLLHVSSIAALGTNKKGLPVTEKDKWEYSPSMSNYSLSKYKSELEVWRGIYEGLDAVIVNPSVIMGTGLVSKSPSHTIFDLVNKGLKIYPPGSVGIVDVEDVANIMIALMNDKSIRSERFILNSANISNKDLLTKIARLLNKKEPKIAAKPFLLNVAWRLAKVAAFFQRKDPALTEESTRASIAKLAYSNEKVLNTLNYTFKPVDDTLQQIKNTYYNK